MQSIQALPFFGNAFLFTMNSKPKRMNGKPKRWIIKNV